MKKSVKILPKKPPIPKRKNVCAYARVSSGKDAMLHSLSAQISYYSEYIQSNPEWNYIGVYADSAVSGTKDNRAEFNRMLEDCRAGLIDMVIVKSISRFARNTVTLLETVRELKACGVDVYFEEQNIHSKSGDGELMLTVLASFAQEESRSVSENCKWRIRKNYEMGIANNFNIYGYYVRNKVLTVNDEQANVVREVFDMYLGGKGTAVIAGILNERKIPSPMGGIWYQAVIMLMLKNEKYAGDMILQKQYSENHITKRTKLNNGQLAKYEISGNHEPIVDREVFNAVQERIKQNANKYSSVRPYEYELKGKVFCGCCGAKYYRKKMHTGTVSEHFIWRCTTYSNKGTAGCESKQITDEVLKGITAGQDFEKIIVTENNRVKLINENGTEQIFSWKSGRGRRDGQWQKQ